MNTEPNTPKRTRGQRVWTDAQRAEQAAKLRARKIWLKSTGPKTPEGKTIVSRNARSENYEQRKAEREEYRKINAYLRTQKSYIDLLKLFIKQEDRSSVAQNNVRVDDLNFLENKLIDLERQICGGMTFYEMIGMDNYNIISFPPCKLFQNLIPISNDEKAVFCL